MATGSAISAHNPRGLHRDGWSLLLSSQLAPPLDDIVTSAALGAACGAAGVRVRQAMHADTWLASAGGDEVFVKIIRAPEGLVRLKRMVRGSIAMHVAAITASLQRDGFRARLRNLVQLGRFALTGVTKTDRMRVWRGYVDAGDERRARHRLRRLARMIRARVTRDGLAAGSDSKPMLARRRVGET